MKKLRLHLLFMAMVAAITFPAAAGAAPGKDKHNVSGNWVDCNVAPLTVADGLPSVIAVGIRQNFSGILVGTYTGSERDVIDNGGNTTFSGGGIFTGTVAGRSGTATFRYEGIVPAVGDIPPRRGSSRA